MEVKNINTQTKVLFSAVLVITAFAFLPSLLNGFVNWDDPTYVFSNPTIQFLSWPHIREIFTSFVVGNYHPLTMMVFAFEYHGWQLDPFFYHLINLIFHLANTALAFYFIYLLNGKASVALIVAFLFGLHPTRVESVAWITELKDVLFTSFFLSSLIVYLKFFNEKKSSYSKLVWVFVLFILSLLSKQSAISLPIVLCLIDYFQGRRWTPRVFWEKIPFFVAAFVFGLWAVHGAMIPTENPYPLIPDYNLWERINFSFYSLLFYVYQLVFPFNLSCFYPYPTKMSGVLPDYVLTSSCLFLMGAWLLWRWRRTHRTIVFGCLFFVLTIMFNLPFFGVGYTITADRFTYIPYMGLFFIIGLLLDRVYEYYQRNHPGSLRILWAVGILAVGILINQTWNRCKVWKDNWALWTDVIEKFPQEPLAYYNRVDDLIKAGKIDLAIKDYSTAIELYPKYFAAYNNRGNMYFLSGQPDRAVADYQKAIELNPVYLDPYLNIASYYISIKDFRTAEAYCDRVLAIDPGNTKAIESKKLLLEKMKAM